jgi:hypothetical protein
MEVTQIERKRGVIVKSAIDKSYREINCNLRDTLTASVISLVGAIALATPARWVVPIAAVAGLLKNREIQEQVEWLKEHQLYHEFETSQEDNAYFDEVNHRLAQSSTQNQKALQAYTQDLDNTLQAQKEYGIGLRNDLSGKVETEEFNHKSNFDSEPELDNKIDLSKNAYTEVEEKAVKKKIKLPELIAHNRITQLFVAGTRVGKTALVKATIAEVLKNYPNTTFFISACKKNDWFGLETIKSKEYGHHHSLSNGLNIEGIYKQVKNAFNIYKYRAENLDEEEQKSSPKVILILDDWLVQCTLINQMGGAEKKEIIAMLTSIANNGAGCNVTIWGTGQSANIDAWLFLDGSTRKTMNFCALGRIVNSSNGQIEGGYDAIDTQIIQNANKLFGSEELIRLKTEYKKFREKRDVDDDYSIAPLALCSIGAKIWFEELEDYSNIIEEAKAKRLNKRKPASAEEKSEPVQPLEQVEPRTMLDTLLSVDSISDYSLPESWCGCNPLEEIDTESKAILIEIVRNGWSQNRVISEFFKISKRGGNDPLYEAARALYKEYKKVYG